MDDGIEYLLWRHALPDGEVTTLYAVRHPVRSTRVRVVHFTSPQRLDVWCVANGIGERSSAASSCAIRTGRSASSGSTAGPCTTSRWSRPGARGDEWLLAVACDGRRSRVDGGLSMIELVETMVELGPESGISLDGRRLDDARPAGTSSTGRTPHSTSRRPRHGRSSARWPASREPEEKASLDRPGLGLFTSKVEA
jgi:hypothetical protein